MTNAFSANRHHDSHQTLAERLVKLLRAFSARRIVVLGDMVADQFLYGEISRVSREAPVLILRHERTETVPGGAANCALNLAMLGARAAIIGVVGDDAAGHALLNKLSVAGVDCSGVVQTADVRTTTKVRILAGHAHSTRQQVIRVDYEDAPLSDPAVLARLASQLQAMTPSAEAVIISDYNYGVVDARTINALRQATRAKHTAVLVDSRFQLMKLHGFTAATPNEDEVEQLLGRRLDDRAALEAAGHELRERLGYASLLITRGSQGMLLVDEQAQAQHIEAVGAQEAVDVTGAGDTVIATYALALASGATAFEAAQLANRAGGLVVMKRGTASVTPEELLASLLHH